MSANLFHIDHPLKKSKVVIDVTLRYWMALLEFSARYNKYDDLIYVLDQIKVSKLPKSEYWKLYSECLNSLINLVSEDDLEEDVDPRLDSIFDALKKLAIDYSSDEYVLLFNRFHRYSRNWSNYDKFLNWWKVDRINLRYSSKLIYSKVFHADITIRESYFLVMAVTYIRMVKKGMKLRKRELNKLKESLEVIRSLNYTNRTSISCYKIEGHLHLILNNSRATDAFILRYLRKKMANDWVLGYIAEAMQERPETQLNLISYLATRSSSISFKIDCLRKLLPVYNQLGNRILAKSASLLIKCICSKNGLPSLKTDDLGKSIDDVLYGIKPSKEELLKDIKTRSQKVNRLILKHE